MALVCRNVNVNGRRTSLRMEEDMWTALVDVAERAGCGIPSLVSMIDRNRVDITLTSAVRVTILTFYRLALDAPAEISAVDLLGTLFPDEAVHITLQPAIDRRRGPRG